MSASVFEGSVVPPPAGSTEFSLDLWDEVRSFVTTPRWIGPLDTSPDLRLESLAGAALMGYRLEPWDPERRAREISDPKMKAAEKKRRRAAGYAEQIVPQQLLMWDALNAGCAKNSIEVQRRAAKTTSIIQWLLGRLSQRDDYMATFSAQNGVKGSARLREWGATLDRENPPDDLHLPPWLRGQRRTSAAAARRLALFDIEPEEQPATSGRGFRIMRGEVGKGIYFDNGSQLLVLKPDAEAYRGEAGDVSWLDEAQELDPIEGEDLMAGLMPLADTKPGAMIVVSGTTGEARVGPHWDRVRALREGIPNNGGAGWGIDPLTPWEDIVDPATALELTRLNHPGVGTLTTIDLMAERHRDLGKPKYAREYLSFWPETVGETAVDLAAWRERGDDERSALPTKVAFGFAVKPRGGSGSIAAAWRDLDGVGHVAVLEHQIGTDWIPRKAQEIGLKYPAGTFAHDQFGDDATTATEMERVRGRRPKLQRLNLTDREQGCIQLARDITSGKVRHGNQAMLDYAVANAGRRKPRGSDEGRWVFTPLDDGGSLADITPLDACVMALRNWDKHYAAKANQTTIRRGVRTAA